MDYIVCCIGCVMVMMDMDVVVVVFGDLSFVVLGMDLVDVYFVVLDCWLVSGVVDFDEWFFVVFVDFGFDFGKDLV